MKTYLVAWQIADGSEARHRRQFLGRLASFDARLDTGIASITLVGTDWTARQIAAYLSDVQRPDDRLLVVRVDAASIELASPLSEEASRWLARLREPHSR